MKKTALLLFALCSFMATAFAQTPDCHAIVLPHLGYNEDAYFDMPQEKIDWHCQFSTNSFFVADSLPENARIFNIEQLKSKKDGKNLTAEFVVDLTTMSIYAYNFEDYQIQYPEETIFFRTPASEHHYLGVRSYIEAMRLTNGY